MTPLLIPLEGHGHHGGFDGGSSVLPVVDSLLLLLVMLAGAVALYLWRKGKLTLPTLAARRSPEDQAKQILADRFAHGDISTDEFMERSSILNWTPGSDPSPRRGSRKQSR
jgi:putative membrane protein